MIKIYLDINGFNQINKCANEHINKSNMLDYFFFFKYKNQVEYATKTKIILCVIAYLFSS